MSVSGERRAQTSPSRIFLLLFLIPHHAQQPDRPIFKYPIQHRIALLLGALFFTPAPRQFLDNLPNPGLVTRRTLIRRLQRFLNDLDREIGLRFRDPRNLGLETDEEGIVAAGRESGAWEQCKVAGRVW